MMYKEYCADNDIEAENYAFYKKVFHENFDFNFQKLKQGQCNMCNNLKKMLAPSKHGMGIQIMKMKSH